jgi:acetyl esterase/lipase
MITDWDDAYANRAHIPGADGIIATWAPAAEDYRARLGPRARLDIPYGPSPRNLFDLFIPEDAPKGLAVFVHGGYWMAFDKSVWSHLASGAVAAGWAVALPSYSLAPEARLGRMTQEVAAAITRAATLVDGPIRLAGHSAGGHLVSRMACADSPLDPATRGRLAHILSISGVHDLRPLRATKLNDTLQIDEAEAHAESPALLDPVPGTLLTAWVGAAERPEFLRQTDLLANAWTLPGIATRAHHDPQRHHFDVIAGLTDRLHPLTRAFTGEDGWA